MAAAFAGCSVHPLPADVSRVSTVDIVRNIRCEAKKGLAGFEADKAAQEIIEATVIGFDFEFHITESNSATKGELNFQKLSGGLSKLDFDADASLQRENKRNFQIVENLRDLKKADCSGAINRANPVYPITGAIGMDEVVRTFIKLDKLTAFSKASKNPPGFEADTDAKLVAEFLSNTIFSDDIDFTTTLKAGAKPELVLDAGIGSLRVTKASIIGSAKRYDKHSVVVALGRTPLTQLDTVAAGPATRVATGAATKIQYDARKQELLATTKENYKELVKTVRDPRVQAALIQAHADTRTSVLMELDRKRKLRHDEVEPASALGQRLLEVLKLP